MAMRDAEGGFSNAALGGEYNAEAPPLREKYGEPPSQPYGDPTAQPQYNNAPPQYYSAPPQKYGPHPQQYGAPPQQYGVYTQPQAGYSGDKPPSYVSSQPQYGQTSNTTTVITSPYGPSAMLVVQPMREAGPAPTTCCSLAMAILAIFFCLGGWPFAVVSIIFNRKAHGQVQLGQYTTARSSLRTAYIFLAVAIVLGIIGWAIFAVRLKAALDEYNTSSYRYTYRG